MRKSILVLMLAAAFAGTTLFAQSERRRSGNTERNTHQTTAETLKKWEEVQTQLKQKYPEKFAEIEKLQKTNIFAALEKMRALARENNVTLPSSGRGGREGFRQGGFGGGERGEGFRQGGFGGGERGEGFRQGGFGGQGGFGSRQNQRTTAEDQIKKLYPTEYAEVEKLRVTIEEKLQALAKKGNVTLPESAETLRAKMAAVREKYKTEFAEIDKLRETDPRAAMERTREIFQKEGITFNGMGMGMGRGGMTSGSSEQAQPQQHRANPMEKLNQIRQKYPEEFAKIQALRRDNPEEYRKQLQALVAKFDAETAKAK